jgi:hypothetical protein
LKVDNINVPSGAFRFCDLGFILSPSTPIVNIDTGQVFPSITNNGELLFWIDSRFRPNAGTTYLSPGRYRLKISAFGKNAARASMTLIVEWSGKWRFTTQEMIENEIIFS